MTYPPLSTLVGGAVHASMPLSSAVQVALLLWLSMNFVGCGVAIAVLTGDVEISMRFGLANTSLPFCAGFVIAKTYVVPRAWRRGWVSAA